MVETKFVDIEFYLQRNGGSLYALKERCSDKHIPRISKAIDYWDLVAPDCELDGPAIAAIKRNNDLEELRRHAMLTEWKRKKCPQDTYEALIKAFLRARRIDLARAVCDILIEEGKIHVYSS